MPLFAWIAALSIFTIALPPAQALRVKDEQVILDELDDYHMCFRRHYAFDFCNDALKRWVKDRPADAFKAGKMVRLQMNHWAAIPYFTEAFDQKKGDCKDEDVHMAVVSALNLPGESYKDVVDQAKKIGLNTCFNEMKQKLADAASIDSYLFKNACKELSAKGALTGLKKKKCDSQQEKS